MLYESVRVNEITQGLPDIFLLNEASFMKSFEKSYYIYDLLYSDKDYKNECELIDKLIKDYKPQSKKILDYGCGTGKHAFILAQNGYDIVGLDISAEMLSMARKRCEDSPNVLFESYGWLSNADKIDVCIAMFDVISYLNSNREINEFFLKIKHILNPGGLIIFDFWHGPSVCYLNPENRWKHHKSGDIEIIRLTQPVHNRTECNVTVKHDVLVIENNKVVDKFIEYHSMRYFFKKEMDIILDYHGFKILELGTINDYKKSPTEKDWSAFICAKVI